MLKQEVEHFSCSIGMSLFTIDRGNQSDNEGGAERGGGALGGVISNVFPVAKDGVTLMTEINSNRPSLVQIKHCSAFKWGLSSVHVCLHCIEYMLI